MKPRIVVVGSSNTDMILKLARIPRPGETVLGGEYLTAAGGKGANQAVAAARAGGRVSLVARVGHDAMGRDAVAGYSAEGIDVRHVGRERGVASGVAVIYVSRQGENCIGVASGANDRLSPAHVRRARPLLRQARVLLMQLETPLDTLETAARIAAAQGALVILNPAPARTLPRDLLRLVSILTPNESEAELLSGIRVKDAASAGKAAQVLRRRGVGTVVVTLGVRGALLADAAGEVRVPGFKVKAVDTTGAGDVFNGALAVALTEGRSLAEAVVFANAAAALSVTTWGAQRSAPTRRAIARFLTSHNA